MASLALQFDANKIYYGAHLDDSGAIYADTSEEFIDSITRFMCCIRSGIVVNDTITFYLL